MDRRDFLKGAGGSLSAVAFKRPVESDRVSLVGCNSAPSWAVAELSARSKTAASRSDATRIYTRRRPAFSRWPPNAWSRARPNRSRCLHSSGPACAPPARTRAVWAMRSPIWRRAFAMPGGRSKAFQSALPAGEKPANAIRAISRLFCSDVQDKPWFYDRRCGREYFSMLAAKRFNRFHLAFGIGYDFLRDVTDAYFLFLYPFLLTVPGYNVRVGEPARRGARPQSRNCCASSATRPRRTASISSWASGCTATSGRTARTPTTPSKG